MAKESTFTCACGFRETKPSRPEAVTVALEHAKTCAAAKGKQRPELERMVR